MNKLSKTPATTLMSIVLITLSIHAFAGNSNKLAGVYTIGKSGSANYQTITAATNALKSGVSGSVTFNIEKGTYNEHVVISNIPGISEFNTVTFASASGDNADVVISNANNSATVEMNGVSFVYFSKLTIDHKAAAAGNALRVEGASNHLNFKGVAFYGVETTKTGADYAAINFANGASHNSISFSNCEISNGSIGIAKSGVSSEQPDTRTSISNTLFFNQYQNALALNNEEAPFIGSNVISSASNFSLFKAISLENVSGSLTVRSNTINIAAGSVGLAMDNCSAKTGKGQISDNAITMNGRTETYGVVISGNTENQVISYNKVKLAENGTHTVAQAYYQNNSTGSNIAMQGNFGYGINGMNAANESLSSQLVAQK